MNVALRMLSMRASALNPAIGIAASCGPSSVKVFAKESRIELDRGLPAKTKLTIVLGE